jgi:hypothetical protein
MLDELQRISKEALVDNVYLGRQVVTRLQGQLEALPPGPHPSKWQLYMQLGQHELRLGREEAALEHYRAAYELLPRFRDMPREQILDTIFELAVAHMRVAETRNCARRHAAESCILPLRGAGVHADPEPSTAAIELLQEVLARAEVGSEAWVRSRWLLNIACMTLGRHPEGVPAEYRIPLETFGSDASFPHFTNVAPQLGLDVFNLSGGAIGEDFDGDGDLDVMVSTLDTAGQMRLFRNDGNGTFSERTREAGLSGLYGGLNMTHADYDNDGDPDVLVLRGAWFREGGRHPNSLLRNNGDGTFLDVTFLAGLGDVHYPTQTAAWGDYDLDGDLDLYVGNETHEGLDAPCQLFRNDGDGTFTDVARRAGVENGGYAKAVAWGDYDGDRYPDLFVSNGGNKNRLYHNDRDGTFTDVAARAGVEQPFHSFPAWFWDFDNDGRLDLYVSSYGGLFQPPDVLTVAASYLGLPHRAEQPRLYRGDGQGGFRDVAAAWGLTRATLPMGSNFGDLDNDGFLDFYLGTGYPRYEGLMPNVMYHNRRGQGFDDVTLGGGFGHLQKGHAVFFADLDDDGDQDVFEQMGGAYPGDAYANVLYENPGFGNHWLEVRLRGTRSNRDGIGARIRVEIVEAGARRTIYKHVNSGGSFGDNPLRQQIGLGRAERIEQLEIYWPASDTRQILHDVAPDRALEISE